MIKLLKEIGFFSICFVLGILLIYNYLCRILKQCNNMRLVPSDCLYNFTPANNLARESVLDQLLCFC